MKKTITQISKEINIAKTTITYHLNKLDHQEKTKYVMTKGNKYLITELGQEYIKSLFNINNNDSLTNENNYPNEIIEPEKNNKIDLIEINTQKIIDTLNTSLNNTQKLLAQEQQLLFETQKQLNNKRIELQENTKKAIKDKNSAVLKAVIITAVITGLVVAIIYNVIYYFS